MAYFQDEQNVQCTITCLAIYCTVHMSGHLHSACLAIYSGHIWQYTVHMSGNLQCTCLAMNSVNVRKFTFYISVNLQCTSTCLLIHNVHTVLYLSAILQFTCL